MGPKGDTGPAGPVGGYEVVTLDVEVGGPGDRTATVSCEDGKQVLGGGCAVLRPDGTPDPGFVITLSFPIVGDGAGGDDDGDSDGDSDSDSDGSGGDPGSPGGWFCSASERPPGGDADSALRVYAICADV